MSVPVFCGAGTRCIIILLPGRLGKDSTCMDAATKRVPMRLPWSLPSPTIYNPIHIHVQRNQRGSIHRNTWVLKNYAATANNRPTTMQRQDDGRGDGHTMRVCTQNKSQDAITGEVEKWSWSKSIVKISICFDLSSLLPCFAMSQAAAELARRPVYIVDR